jgi:hypothetical protein
MFVSLGVRLNPNIGMVNLTPLMVACQKGFVDCVRELLSRGGEQLDVNRCIQGNALSRACDSNQMQVLELLLAHPHIDVNARLRGGGSVLHHVCWRLQLPQLKRLLLVAGIDVNLQSERGFTPIASACCDTRALVVRELLKHPAVNPNIADARGRTPLWMGANHKMHHIAMMILCSPFWLIDTTTMPVGETMFPRFQTTIEEYRADPAAFRQNYSVVDVDELDVDESDADHAHDDMDAGEVGLEEEDPASPSPQPASPFSPADSLLYREFSPDEELPAAIRTPSPPPARHLVPVDHPVEEEEAPGKVARSAEDLEADLVIAEMVREEAAARRAMRKRRRIKEEPVEEEPAVAVEGGDEDCRIVVEIDNRGEVFVLD